MTMHVDFYRLPPPHPLRPFLRVFRNRANGAFRQETILPKGNLDILFNLGDALRVRGAGEAEVTTGVFVSGVHTNALVSTPQGAIDLLGVTLPVEMGAALLRLPAHELHGQTVEASHLFPELRDLHGRLHEAGGFERQCDLIMAWITARLQPGNARLVRHACSLLRRSPAEEPVRHAAGAIGVSPRHLQRLVSDGVGLSPSRYLRLVRFVDAMHRMAAPGATLTHVAHAAGYFDQAHFCREFQSFAGMAPGEYRSRAGPVVGHIFSA